MKISNWLILFLSLSYTTLIAQVGERRPEIGLEGFSMSKDMGLVNHADHTMSFQIHAPIRLSYLIPFKGTKHVYWVFSGAYIDRLYEVDQEDSGESLTFKGGEGTVGFGWVFLPLKDNKSSIFGLSGELAFGTRLGKIIGEYSSIYFTSSTIATYRANFDGSFFEIGPMLRLRISVDITDRFALTLAPRLRVAKRFSANFNTVEPSIQVISQSPPSPEGWGIDHELLTVGVFFRI